MTNAPKKIEYDFDEVQITGPELSSQVTNEEINALIALIKHLAPRFPYNDLSGLLIGKGCSPELAAFILDKAGVDPNPGFGM